MEIIIRPTAESASDLVARVIADELRAKPNLVLGLATGNTMEASLTTQVPQANGGTMETSQRIVGKYLGPCAK